MSNRSASKLRARAVLGVVALVAAWQLCICGQAVAQGPPTVTVGTPTIKGDYVNLSGTIVSGDNCAIGIGDCPARYIISAPPLPPQAGVTLVPMFWSNMSSPQQFPLAADMRAIRSQLKLPPTTTQWTVTLQAQYGGSLVQDSTVQTFTWPAGTLSVSHIQLLRADAPELAYRLSTGRTEFRSAVSTVTIRTSRGQRLGTFRAAAEPGQNLVAVPRRLARRLIRGVAYRITMSARDEFGRSTQKSALSVL
jgi:hypothetical protein